MPTTEKISRAEKMKCSACVYLIRCMKKKKADLTRWRKKYAKSDRRKIEHALKV